MSSDLAKKSNPLKRREDSRMIDEPKGRIAVRLIDGCAEQI